jgi:hypothetical protein
MSVSKEKSMAQSRLRMILAATIFCGIAYDGLGMLHLKGIGAYTYIFGSFLLCFWLAWVLTCRRSS